MGVTRRSDASVEAEMEMYFMVGALLYCIVLELGLGLKWSSLVVGCVSSTVSPPLQK